MQRKYPFDALAVRDAAHGESFVQSATLPADHYAGKDLDSFLVSFDDASMHAHTIANRKLLGIVLLLFFLNGIDDSIHNSPPAARLRAHTLIRRHGFCNPKSPSISARPSGTTSENL
jgi:hypothetical protein